jgi:hypothetical protein
MSFIADYVKAVLFKEDESPRQAAGTSKAPFPDPQNLDEFLVDLQYASKATRYGVWTRLTSALVCRWLEDEVSHIPVTLAPKEHGLVHRESLINTCVCRKATVTRVRLDAELLLLGRPTSYDRLHPEHLPAGLFSSMESFRDEDSRSSARHTQRRHARPA